MAKVLFLTYESPLPPRGSDKFRDFHVLKLLCEKMDEVEVLCLSKIPEELPSDLEVPKNLKISEIEKHDPGFFHRLFNPRPLNVYSDSIEKVLESHARPNQLLWISRLLMASCVPLARSLGYRVVLDEHNVDSALIVRKNVHGLMKLPNLWAAAQARRYETRFCLKSNAVVATSSIDASRLSKLAPGAHVHIIPNSVDYSVFEKRANAREILCFFRGSLDLPRNIQGLSWFVEEVLPRLRAHLGPRTPRIVVAGANPSPSFQTRLKSQGVEVFANPVDMIPHFAESSVVFVPILSGGGTPLKILEAMAAGRPIVSTGKATEGLVLAPGYDILIADDPDGFTSAILRLLENPEVRKEMGVHASKTIQSRYDWRCARNAVEALLHSVQESR